MSRLVVVMDVAFGGGDVWLVVVIDVVMGVVVRGGDGCRGCRFVVLVFFLFALT